MSTSGIRCAIIGAGPQGLMAAKNLKDESFDITLFDTRSYVGGLWKYDRDSSLSIAAITTFNTSKFRLPITDFPVPEDMDDFPTGEQMHQYLESYCGHFGIRPHLQLNTRVTAVRRSGEEWLLEYQEKGSEKSANARFDKVVIACGTFIRPKQPHFEGNQKFAGKQVHTIDYHNPEQFKDQNVVVVGIHHSAQDVLCSSYESGVKKVYMSHRRGLNLMSRYGANGQVYDGNPPLWFLIISQYIATYFPAFMEWAFDKLLTGMSKAAFPSVKESWGFSPAPSLSVATPVINTKFYDLLEQGYCEPVPDIKRITGPKTIELKNGRVLTDIDAMVYATGYDTIIPLEMDPPDLNPRKKLGAPAELYRGIFPLHSDPKIRNSLAFLCQNAVAYPGYSQFEIQSMIIALVWAGKKSLPPLLEMETWYQWMLAERRKVAKRNNIGEDALFPWWLPGPDHMNWLDEMAGLGIRKRFGLIGRWTNLAAWKLWWSDRELYRICLNGLTSPALFRLFDEGGRKTWDGARAQIFIDNERIKKQQETKFAELQKIEEERKRK